MTNATDELRRLLDERGVEWEAAADSLTTWATGSDTARWCADEMINDRFDLYAYDVDEDVSGLSPEQAIDATLRRGTCKNISNPPSGFLCSECGWGDFAEPSHLLTSACYAGLGKGPRYCPNCGRRVVE